MNYSIFILIFVILLFIWSYTLIFFKDRNTSEIETDESKCFAPKCKSIIYTHEKQSNTAILQIHGFPSTPHVYEYSSKTFYDEGFDTYAYLMPGFGTSIEDFSKTNFTQWFDFQCRKYEELQKKYENVFILGISMGGLISLKLGEKYSNTKIEPNAIISISAPIVYNSFIKDRIITNPSFVFARILNLFKHNFKAATVSGIESEDGNEDWTGYKGLFLKQSLSLIKAEKIVRKNLDKLTCPLFSIHDTGDKTVPFKNFPIIASENKSRSFRGLVWRMGNFNHSHHVLLLYKSSRVRLTKEIITYIKENINA